MPRKHDFSQVVSLITIPSRLITTDYHSIYMIYEIISKYMVFHTDFASCYWHRMPSRYHDVLCVKLALLFFFIFKSHVTHTYILKHPTTRSQLHFSFSKNSANSNAICMKYTLNHHAVSKNRKFH